MNLNKIAGAALCAACVSVLSLATSCVSTPAPAAAAAGPRLDSVFQDGFVFSAKHRTTLTGQTAPGAEVVALARGGTYKATAGEDGRFAVKLPTFGVQKKPFDVVVFDAGGTNAMRGCLSGIVLLAAGQSNMEVPVEEALDPEKEIAAANYPLIREFRVEHDFDFVPQRQCKGKWTTVSPATAARVGAIGLYTARLIQEKLDGVPVGIINNSYSGSSIQPWLPLGILRAKYPNRMGDYDRFAPLGRDGAIRRREELGRAFLVKDEKNEGEPKGWHRGPQADWKDLTIPGWVDGQVWGESSDGAFWIARTFTAPDDMLGKDVEFHATAIDDFDTTYVNGVRIGATGEETPDPWEQPRAYKIRKGLLKKGENTIAIRIFDTAHAGGVPPGPHAKICLADGAREFSLAGTWKTQVERLIPAKAWPADYLPLIKIYHAGSVLYNAMAAPLTGAPVDAALWYQGESNAGQPEYGEMLTDLIMSWRAAYGERDLPFVVVQLAAFQARPQTAEDVGSWPLTRQQQAEVCERLPNVRLVPTIDIGDANRIHPLNKQEVGRRAALVLLQDFLSPKSLGIDMAYPQAVSARRVGGEVVVTLKNASGLHTTDGRAPQSFAIVGTSDRNAKTAPAVWAETRLDGEKIRVKLPPHFQNQKRIRYAWCMNPDVNTVNAQGLPLLPFDLDILND